MLEHWERGKPVEQTQALAICVGCKETGLKSVCANRISKV